MRAYSITKEPFEDAWHDIEPLARAHYAETQRRFEEDGLAPLGDFSPRLDLYFKAAKAGYLHCWVVRDEDGFAVGHCTAYVQSDMHNRDRFAKEDTIYILPEHRRGIGMKLSKTVMEWMKQDGCRRMTIDARTDPRAIRLWERMGFKPVSQVMMIEFEGA